MRDKYIPTNSKQKENKRKEQKNEITEKINFWPMCQTLCPYKMIFCVCVTFEKSKNHQMNYVL